jgi:fibronectin-binding autotransporter adhesin
MAARQGSERFFTHGRVAAAMVAVLVAMANCGDALAQNGTWTATTSGSWQITSNWSGGIVGTGSANTATFAPDITSDVTVTNNQQRLIGTMVFGTASAPTGTGNWIVSGSLFTVNNGGSNATITVNSLRTANIASVLQVGTPNNAMLVKNGAGTLILSSTGNNISINVGITNGTLQISNDNQLGGAPGSFVANRLQISNGATLRTNGASTLTQNRGITIGSGGGTLSINGSALTYGGRLTGTGNTATVTGSNALTLTNVSGVATNVNWDFASNSGVRTFFQGSNALGTGSVTVRNGVRLTSQSTAPTSGQVTNAVAVESGGGLTNRSTTGTAVTYTNVTLPSSGSILLNNDDQSTTGLTISSGGTLTGDLTVDTTQGGTNAVGNVTLSGVFSGAGGLVKAGTGTSGIVILGAANTYTGNTTISTGTLKLGAAGSIANSGTISVASGAWFDTSLVPGGFSLVSAQLLQGSGTVLGSVTAQGTLSPGLSGSVGTLSFANDLALGSGSILSYELNGANTAVGGGINDLSAVAGNLTLDGTLNVSEIGVGSFLSATVGNIWRLFTYAGTLTNNGLSLGTVPTLSSGLTLAFDTSTPNEVNLIVVPEPTAAVSAMAGVGLIALLRARLTRKANRAIRDGCRLNEQR